MDSYTRWMLLLGVACFGAAWLPHLLRGKPLSFPIVYVALGAVAYLLPLDLVAFDPIASPYAVERLTELIVIVALMGVGLKIDRPVGWRSWSSTWRLLAVTMPLSIAAFASIGWLFLGLSPATAILLGAVLAPTDPVLAAEVQAAPPMEGEDHEVPFALTSESGLNDALAFPFTNLALALAAASSTSGAWFSEWLWVDVVYKLSVGLLAGVVIGYLLAWLVFCVRLSPRLAETGEGIAALAITLISYAATEMVGGYGFLAVFVSALMIRRYERNHRFHKKLHEVTESVERLLMAVLLVMFGGALATGLLASLGWEAAIAGLAFVFLVRPLSGLVGLWGSELPTRHKSAIAFFGIRGVGSFYYLAYALHQQDFSEAEELWATVGFVVLVSILIHGITATPAMKRVEQKQMGP